MKDEKKKSKLKMIMIYAGLSCLILFVVITSILIQQKKEKNQELEKVIDNQEIVSQIKNNNININL